MSIHLLVLEMKKMLHNLDGCLDKAVAHAGAKKFDAETLLVARLAPDQFALLRQIQIVCDHGEVGGVARVGQGRAVVPRQREDDRRRQGAHRDDDRVPRRRSAGDFASADTVQISLPRWEGKSMTGTEYFVEHALPNFFFHVTTAYAILRHNGVDIGKRDYLGTTPMK